MSQPLLYSYNNGDHMTNSQQHSQFHLLLLSDENI